MVVVVVEEEEEVMAEAAAVAVEEVAGAATDALRPLYSMKQRPFQKARNHPKKTTILPQHTLLRMTSSLNP